jgi:hypothetical protein
MVLRGACAAPFPVPDARFFLEKQYRYMRSKLEIDWQGATDRGLAPSILLYHESAGFLTTVCNWMAPEVCQR